MKIKIQRINKGKLREIIDILGINLNNQAIDLPELQLDTSDQVAIYKAKEAAKRIGGPVLIDDTALHFNALHGLPGAYIRAFTDKLTPLEISKILDGFDDKSAYVTCSIGFCAGPDAEPVVFTGRVDGTIVRPRGDGGFGFDPIFQPKGEEQTYAELPSDKKNALSHRYLALKNLIKIGKEVKALIHLLLILIQNRLMNLVQYSPKNQNLYRKRQNLNKILYQKKKQHHKRKPRNYKK